MNRELVVDALKSACGNKNLGFQVALQDSQLHIYVSRQPEHRVNYFLLKDNVASAVASLYRDDLETVWLYSYLAGETEPEWQTLFELTATTDIDEDDTVCSGQIFNNCSHAPQIILNTENFLEDNKISDTGLLRDRGIVHGCAMEQFDLSSDTSESPTVLQIADFNLEDNILAQYCFVSNKEILTSVKIFPKREIIRLVIFFHHLDLEDRSRLLPILDSYFKGDRINELELPVALQQWFEQIKRLDNRDRQLLAIWLTRYCSAPSATLKQFEAAGDVVFVPGDKSQKMALCEAVSFRTLRHTEDSSTSANNNQTKSSTKLLLHRWFVRLINSLV